jgi:protein-tyrosine phosphatase
MRTTKWILLLCTGNYYRSRHAEELFTFCARTRGFAWRAFSRGATERGTPDNIGPMSRFTLEALKARKIAPEGAARYFDHADLIIALKEAEHRPLIEQRFPEVESRVFGRRPDNNANAHTSS